MNYAQFVKILKSSGFYVVRNGKHVTYSNGIKTITVPHKHGSEINKMLAKKLLKEMEG